MGTWQRAQRIRSAIGGGLIAVAAACGARTELMSPEAPNGAASDGAPPDSAPVEAMPAPVSLGHVWYDVEAGGNCHGIWTRIGTSSQFSAAWPDCRVTAQLTITVVGANVFVTRTNSSDGNDCHYAGVLAPDGLTVSGTYSCTVVSTAGSPGWSARIM
jgi:hypothetical protein